MSERVGRAVFAKAAIFLFLCTTLSPQGATQHSQQNRPTANPYEVIDEKAIASTIEEGIQQKRLPGADVLVGHGGHVIFRHAYGMRSLEPAREPMTLDTIFDMASLTKPLVTALAIMQLAEQGRLRIDDPVALYLPEFAVNGKADITIRQLLTHYSGLPADLDLYESWQGKEEGYRRVFAIAPITAPGVQFRYSDLNFITLGAVVEKISGLSLDTYAKRQIIQPLGLTHTGFVPSVSMMRNIAPTQYDEHHVMLRGVVHDPTSRRMGGVAGNAGLFSTADDLAKYAQSLLNRLEGRPSRFPLSRVSLMKMTSPGSPATGTALRGLGWDIESPFSSNRGELFPVGSFGHTGFTGTSLWIDPTNDAYVIVLANAVHPNGPKGITTMRAEIANVVARSLGVKDDHGALAAKLTGYNESLTGMRRWDARTGSVNNGIDVLEADDFAELVEIAKAHHGALRVGLLTNQTGLDHQGRRTIDVLAESAQAAVPGLKLTTIFSPEHGISGSLDVERIENDKDKKTGLPIVSLYGVSDEQRRPTLAAMRELDAVIIDLQDAGARFYTYESVVRYFLEAAAKTGTEIVILDRPNPIGGAFVQGPLSDVGADSYVNVARLPVRHGMTLGELARWLNGTLDLNSPLQVVAMKGWQRGDWFDSTGQLWVNPSPNLRNLNEATLYPALGLIETTNLSVGRGTSTPFEIVGAPWIDGIELAHQLNSRDLPGIRFIPITFTPQKPYPYAGEICGGVNLVVTARNDLNSPEIGLEVAAALRKQYPDRFNIQGMNRLLANKGVLEELSSGRDPQRIEEEWQDSLREYEDTRRPYLLY